MDKKPGVVRVTVDRMEREERFPLEGEDGRWRVYTFGEDISSDVDPGVFLREHPDFEEKLKSGLAWMFEVDHCNCYEIDEELIFSENCCGVIIWEEDESEMGSDLRVDRKVDAHDELKEFESWVNGEVYSAKVEYIKSVAPEFRMDDPSFNGAYWEEIDSDSYLFGSDQVEEFLKEALETSLFCRVVVVGDADHVFSEFETDSYEPTE